MNRIKCLSIFTASALLAAGGASAADRGTLTFEGQVTANTCNVGINGGTDASATIRLPTVSDKALAGTNATAGRTFVRFQLTGGAQCAGAGGLVQTYFESGPTINANGRLINTAAAGAAGVELQILNRDLVVMDLAKPRGLQKALSQNPVNNAELIHHVEYVAPAGSAGPGAVGSTVQYTLDYL